MSLVKNSVSSYIFCLQQQKSSWANFDIYIKYPKSEVNLLHPHTIGIRYNEVLRMHKLFDIASLYIMLFSRLISVT